MSAPSRARAIAQALPADARAAVEVGYDRGLVLAEVVALHPELRLIGVEIQPDAQRHVPPELAARVELLTGDGLSSLATSVLDGVIMAGLGARTMLRVLEAAPAIVAQLRWIVLCPSHFEDDLRPGLARLGWHPATERLVHDRGRFYEVMCAVPGPDPARPDPVAARWGPRLAEARDPLIGPWLADLRHRFRAAFANGLHKAAVGEKLRLIDAFEALSRA